MVPLKPRILTVYYYSSLYYTKQEENENTFYRQNCTFLEQATSAQGSKQAIWWKWYAYEGWLTANFT